MQLEFGQKVGAHDFEICVIGFKTYDLQGIDRTHSQRHNLRILGFERVILFVANRKEHRLQAYAWAGMKAEELAPQLEYPLKRSSGQLALAMQAGLVMATMKPESKPEPID